ncbi:hypothetical protein LCGC14_0456870 [marine sediment metagenome]|uniref:Uncharacterized protein n=1 Tax=marine sediment metagenome TaxID=412755 RepID=A0A0F9SGA5_9ZZZZ|nr:hypothetical protein [Candidatus Aminicenantes bacterium]
MKKLLLLLFTLSTSLYGASPEYVPVARMDLYLCEGGIFYVTDTESTSVQDIRFEEGTYFIKKYIDNAALSGTESGLKVQNLFKIKRRKK